MPFNETSLEVSVVIPTLNREQVLVDTIEALLELDSQPSEILVIDQTERHEKHTENRLQTWSDQGNICWILLPEPSIPAAMNQGLLRARSPLVLFLDDDIVPGHQLVEAHAAAHYQKPRLWATVGQIIQPWQEPSDEPPPRKLTGLKKDFDFPFNSKSDADVENVMAGNLCVNRHHALSLGGFDERFTGVGFRFETEFARRVINAGGCIRFVAKASIAHLHCEQGGTRSFGSLLTSASPAHGFGEYYYCFRHGRFPETWTYSLYRLFRMVRTRFHLRYPWWIPAKLLGETRALLMAFRAARRPPKLIKHAAVPASQC